LRRSWSALRFERVKLNVKFKHFVPSQRVSQLVKQSAARLSKVLNSGSSVVLLRVFVEKNAAHNLYRVSLTLSTPGRTLASQEEGYDLTEAVREAFAELERQLHRHKEKLTHADSYKRPARRKQLRSLTKEAAPIGMRRRAS
jgi:ribosomal subunit interface protein